MTTKVKPVVIGNLQVRPAIGNIIPGVPVVVEAAKPEQQANTSAEWADVAVSVHDAHEQIQ